jgi:hypothetical protein
MLCEAFLAQKSNMEPNVMCETIATTLFDDKDLILTVFRHVPTKYVFAVVTYKELWNGISTSPTLEDWVDDTLYQSSNSLHKIDRQKWVQGLISLRAQPGVDKYDDDDRFAVSELMDHLSQIDHRES